MIVVVADDQEFVDVMVYCLREISCAVTGFVVSAADPIESLAQEMQELNPKMILVPENKEKQSFRILSSFRFGSRAGGVNLAPILRFYFEDMRTD